jgi:hypothetical protein
MRYTRAEAFAGLRQTLAFHGLLAGDDPWCQAIWQRMDGLQERPLTRWELWTISRLVEAVLGRVLGLNPQQNMAANSEDARRKIEANHRNPGPIVGLNRRGIR